MSFPPLPPLPEVRGTYTYEAPLKHLVWFRVGGPAQVLFRPADVADLAAFLQARPAEVALTVIGVGSNLLIRDGGIPGVVIRLPAAFGRIAVEGAHIRAGAATLDSALAKAAGEAGLSGLEFLRGIPGTVGGALVMNAGCYGRQVQDAFVCATAIDACGDVREMSAADMNFAYRGGKRPADLLFVEAVFAGTPDDPKAIEARMAAMLKERESAQPVKSRTGGSTFKNPPGTSAWKLIDEAGCRGLKRGGATVSDMHCNFLINAGDATAADIEALGEEVRARVKAHSGVELEWEIKRVGLK
jgi:UDP-N-acetylmuramate dehydrogenase